MMASKLIKHHAFVDAEAQTEAEEVNFLELIAETDKLREALSEARRDIQLADVRCKRFEEKVESYTAEKDKLYDKYKRTTHDLQDAKRALTDVREDFAMANKYTKDLEKRVCFALSNFAELRAEGSSAAL